MATKYLDNTGLAYFWSKIKSYVASLLSSKADDSAVVHNTGNETVAGVKTFSSNLMEATSSPTLALSNTAVTKGTNPSGTCTSAVYFQDKTSSVDASKRLGGIDCSIDGNGVTSLIFRVFNSGQTSGYNNGYIAIYYPKNGTPYTYAPTPDTSDNSTKIATTAFVKAQGYITSQTPSDERIKTPLFTVPDAVLDAWEDVNWGQFQFLDAVSAKGTSARLHLGLIAQRVRIAFEAKGLDACDYGILCFDKEESLWMVRYVEALAMEAVCQRRRAERAEARIKALEDRLSALEARLD